jgi:alkylation response protein AidB-like acyl-CoA dehydrogenase
MVPAGAIADAVIVYDGSSLSLVPIADDKVVPENLGSMPLADLATAGGIVLASGPDAAAAFESAIDDWLVLTAGALVGMAHRSIEIGVDYVCEREAFGQKIGGFQAIGHRLADCKAAADGAELLAREAAWAHLEEPDRFGELAAMAFAFAAETARDASYWSLHFHGGYGFMLEYDIQLYYRRSRAWANVVMDSQRAYRRVADRRYGPVGVR